MGSDELIGWQGHGTGLFGLRFCKLLLEFAKKTGILNSLHEALFLPLLKNKNHEWINTQFLEGKRCMNNFNSVFYIFLSIRNCFLNWDSCFFQLTKKTTQWRLCGFQLFATLWKTKSCSKVRHFSQIKKCQKQKTFLLLKNMRL